jgi:4-amino-4-deoxy-L-arabinose transferase-like glycosyltransferase
VPDPAQVRTRDRRLLVARVLLYVCSAAVLSTGLLQPMLGMHSWRQTQNAMVARNFVRHGFDPTITLLDLDGGGMLYGVNLPVLCWPTGVGWALLGHESPAVPRLLSLLAALFAAWMLERMGRRIGGPWCGLAAAAIFLQAPLIVGYGASFLEDVVMLACIGLAVDRSWAWGEDARWRDAALIALGIGLSVGIKLPVGALIVPLCTTVALLAAGRLRALLHPQLLVAMGVGIVLGLSYYGGLWLRSQAWPHFEWAFTWEPGTDKWGSLGLLLAPETVVLLYKRTIQEIAGISGLLLIVVGLMACARNVRVVVPLAWLACALVYGFVTLGGQLAHDYYQLVMVQPVALLGACCFAGYRDAEMDWSRLPRWRRWMPLVGIALVIAGAVELQPFRQFLKSWQDPRLAVLADAVAESTEPHEAVLVIDHLRPEVLYYADRRGYHLNRAEVNAELVAERVQRGAVALAILEPQLVPLLWEPAFAEVVDGWVVTSSGPDHIVLRTDRTP